MIRLSVNKSSTKLREISKRTIELLINEGLDMNSIDRSGLRETTGV